MYERPVKRREYGVYRVYTAHVMLSEDEYKMLDKCSDVLMRTKSDLIRDFINELYIECVLNED